jgi:hypothetical protein
MLIHLGYVSTATAPLPRAELMELLAQARADNARNQITGMLVYQGGHFLQVLEGQAEAVRATMERIRQDPRHDRIALLFEEPVAAREFPDWRMGFQALDGREWLEFPGLADAPRDLRAVAQDIARAKQLLLQLRQRGLDPAKDIATPTL